MPPVSRSGDPFEALYRSLGWQLAGVIPRLRRSRRASLRGRASARTQLHRLAGRQRVHLARLLAALAGEDEKLEVELDPGGVVYGGSAGTTLAGPRCESMTQILVTAKRT